MLNDKLQAAIAKFKKQVKWPADTDKFRFKVAETSDYPQIYKLFEETFGKKRSEEHVQWKYWGNPSGEPFSIIAIDRQTDKVIATCPGMRKKTWVNGKESQAWIGWDIVVHPDARGGGRLYRNVTHGLQVAVNALHGVNWGFGGQSKPGVIKMGIRWFGYNMILSLKCWELRISMRPAFVQRFGAFGGLLASVADAFIKRPSLSDNYEMRTIDRCGDAFDTLLQQQKDLYRVSVFRDAATLNWRYFDHPIFVHQMLGAYENDKLVGYIAWREYLDETVQVGTVLDLWHGENQQLASDLFIAASQSARSRQVGFIRMSVENGTTTQLAIAAIDGTYITERVADDNIIASMLFGEDPDAHDAVAYDEMDTITDGANWFYAQGDLDFKD